MREEGSERANVSERVNGSVHARECMFVSACASVYVSATV